MRTFFWFVTILLFFVSPLSCGGSTSQKVVKIGAIVPLTGPAAAPGNEMNNAVILAAEEWNSADKMGGYKIVVDSKDDASDPKQAVSAAHALMSDPLVFGVVAHLNSGCFLPASKIYHSTGVVAISGATTNPQITLQGFPEIFRICSTDLVQGEITGRCIRDLGYSRVAVIHDKTQYGMGLAEVVRDTAAKLGLQVVSFDGIDVGEKDFRALLTKIKDQRPDVVYFGGMYDEAGLIVAQMRALQMDQQFISDDGVFGQDFIDAGGAETEGAIISMVGAPLTELSQADDFMRKYEQRFGTKIQNYGPYAYDVANILLSALARVIERNGRPDKALLLEEVRKTEHDGVIGRTSFDEKGDTRNQLITLYRVTEGKFVPFKTMSLNE
ncbi:MAG: branched-chain amino acid ABC transporter substrate-binding protein [Candidatus Abyssobacteria bacterium SURF_5]|uniref:Branched-chain amino acid ABC transporter substrate-binding protein n=1 Tax=Abyssobacteria bacterium (strain SURF_5) TaxID=2093360 RepID=A0A3A4NMU7_ABYX5|nr:MAG: branched-chain amino acid ABC transporter substrate-binding protein [Candidatus Abyssubacteria bacterium SURF_5]